MNTDKKEILKITGGSGFSYAYRAVALGSESKKWIDYDPESLEEGKRTDLETVLNYKPSVFSYKEEEYRPVCPVCYLPDDMTVIKVPEDHLQETVRKFRTLTLLSNRFGYFVFRGNSNEYNLDSFEIVSDNEAVPVMGLFDDYGITEPSHLDIYFNKKRMNSEADRIISESIDKKLEELSVEIGSILEENQETGSEDFEEESILSEVPKILRSMFAEEDLLVVQEIRNANQNGGFLKTEEILADQDLRKSCLSGVNRDLSRWFCKDGEEFDMLARYAGDGTVPEPVLPVEQIRAFHKLLSAGADPEELFRCKGLEREEAAEESRKIIDSISSEIPGVFDSFEEARENLKVFIEINEDAAEPGPVEDTERGEIVGIPHALTKDFFLIEDVENEGQSASGSALEIEEFSQSSFLSTAPVPDTLPTEPIGHEAGGREPVKNQANAAIETEPDPVFGQKKEEGTFGKFGNPATFRKVEALKSRIDGGLFKSKCSTYKGFTEKALLDEDSIFLDATGREDRYKSRAIMMGVDTSKMYYESFDSLEHLLQLIEKISGRNVYIYGLNCLDLFSRSEALKLRRAAHERSVKVTVFGSLTGSDLSEMFD